MNSVCFGHFQLLQISKRTNVTCLDVRYQKGEKEHVYMTTAVLLMPSRMPPIEMVYMHSVVDHIRYHSFCSSYFD